MGLSKVALDARRFGIGFIMRRQWAKARSRSGLIETAIPGYGPFFTRDRNTDFETVRQVIRDGEYDIGGVPQACVKVDKRYRTILASGKRPVIIDAGANVGAASVFFAAKYPEARIVAIEPDANNVAILRRNAASRSSVSVIEAGIGSSSGYVSIDQAGDGWASRTTRSTSGCSLITVPEAVSTIDDGELFIIKVDIEGFEADLFADNTEWLVDTTLLMIEPHDWMMAGTSASLQRTMGPLGFEMYLRGENLFYLNPKFA